MARRTKRGAKPNTRAKATKAKSTAKSKTKTAPRSGMQRSVLGVFREAYGGDEADAAILALNPNDFDRDPAEFFEKLEGELELTDKARDLLFGHTGTVGALIDALIAAGAAPPQPGEPDVAAQRAA